MKKVSLVLVLLIFLVACQNEEKPLTYDLKVIKAENLSLCDEGLCPEISIDKITMGGGAFADTINKAVEQHLINLLIIDPDEVNTITSLDEALKNFVQNYRVYRNDFPEAIPEYEVSSTSSISFDNGKLLCLAFDDYTYYGGAHGYGSTHFINFDENTKEVLTTETLFKDLEGFKILAEKRFRSQYQLAPKEDLGETGYFFTEDNFDLPQNIGFKNDQLILLYNPYEIASYAEGQLILRFDLAEVKDYLNPNL
ncbi:MULTISPECIES: DUF3298 and DUF4163 domain-containing protein [unclassified Leeuwenhoekiella]|uniref:DUF3298 and DUF4163 domain-containing protein n=1 Tax=unclassified Leeuwenhoekiella TaxID=2615029 RepID=UPI000C648C23|nr:MULTISPECIES: DUF3298 and DUF4163 domain-containing protein [unclassified Leeuwenhoekiella]MAW95829.1 hypothetical protein [Leeuwenhoekiella sp.]MBA82900.1 hypothetical protein [Leeuwenhoekiella sp.]